VQDYQRFNQIGRASGWISLRGKRIEIRNWWACRDHSWGVRPGMGIPEPINSDAAAGDNFFFCFLFFSTDTLAGHVQLLQSGPGRRYVSTLLRHRVTGEKIHVEDIDVGAELLPNTRIFRRVSLRLAHRGEPMELSLTRLGSSISMPGLGYSGGWNDQRGLGAWRGATYKEHEVWDVSDPVDVVCADGTVLRPFHRIHPVTVAGSDGSTGTGSFTWIVRGDALTSGAFTIK
jgi:hypothetical protein